MRFARTLVNSGRLSVPATLHDSPLNTPDVDAFGGADGARRAGRRRAAARRRRADWLLRQLGADFTLLLFGRRARPGPTSLPHDGVLAPAIAGA